MSCVVFISCLVLPCLVFLFVGLVGLVLFILSCLVFMFLSCLAFTPVLVLSLFLSSGFLLSLYGLIPSCLAPFMRGSGSGSGLGSGSGDI